MPLSLARFRNSFWFFQSAGWLAFITFQFCLRMFLFGDVRAATVLTCLMEPASFCLTLVMRAYYRRKNLPSLERWKTAIIAILCSFAGACVMSTLWHGINSVLNWHLLFTSSSQLKSIPLFYYFMIFTTWNYLYFWLGAESRADEEYKRAIQAESDMLRTELKFLRAQLDPHFLCNVLNSVIAEIPKRPALACDMASQLAGYLRYSLDNSEETRAPLAEEMRSVKSYLELYSNRFEDRLSYELDIRPDTLHEEVPGCLLQPLVENAIKHGMRTDPAKLKVHVHASRTDDGLLLSVRNNGQLADHWKHNERGVGIKNLRRRLELLYPGRHQFTLSLDKDQVTAQLELQGEPCCG